MTASSQIPFELNQTSLTQWLDQLNSPDPLTNGFELYKVLNQLKKQYSDLDTDALALCLDRLAPATLPVLEFLQRELSSGHETLSVKQSKAARLSIAVLDLLAFLQGCLIQRDLEPAKRRSYCDAALQTLAVSSFHCALSYNRLPAEHWRTLAFVYRVCETEGFLDSPSTALFAEFQRLQTLESVLKCQLLFFISQPLRFSRAELPALFGFCADYHGKVQLKRLGRYSGEGFSWDFADAKPPVPVCANSGKAGLSFNVDDLVKAARNRELSVEEFDAQTFWDDVTHYASFSTKSYLPVLAFPCVVTCGFDQSCLFFQNHVRGGLVSKITSPSPDKINFSTLDLVREESKNKSAISHVLAEDIWGKPAESQIKKVHFAAIKAFNTERPNFIVIESTKSDLLDLDIVAFYQVDMAPKLAIVRRVESAKLLNGNTKALLEILPGEVTLTSVRLGTDAKTVLLLKRGNITELIAASGQFNTGSSVDFEQGSFRLMRLIEDTDYFVRYLVSVA